MTLPSKLWSRKQHIRHQAGLAIFGCLLVGTLLAAHAAASTILCPNDHVQGIVYLDAASHNGRCLAADLREDETALPALQTPDLIPGLYRADFHLRVSHTVNRHVARLEFTLSATQQGAPLAARHFKLIAFEAPHQYQNFSLFFTVKRAGSVALRTAFAWNPIQGQKRPCLQIDVTPRDLLSVEDVGQADDMLDLQLEHELKEQPWYLTLDRITLNPVQQITVQNLAVDKIRYAPGAYATISGQIVNHSDTPHNITLITELIHDMDMVDEADRRDLTLLPDNAYPFSFDAPVGQAPWGREIRVRVLDGTEELHRASEYFTVHSNPWAVAIGSYGINLPYYRAGKAGEKAPKLAQRLKHNYANTVEFVFWAEDDFGDLTPVATPYWSGQMRHESGAESTRQLITACHTAGIACSFYALYIVADGQAGYELYRKHPDWFRPAFYDVSHFDRWERSSNLISWPRVSVRSDTPEPYRHHADEIIRSVHEFGWDSIRYDTDMSVKEMDGAQPHVAQYFPETKARVNAACPQFQWGYNDALHRHDLTQDPELQQLFALLCSNGGMIMDEYNNHAFQDHWTYEKYTGRHRYIRRQVHSLGGHFTLCPFDLEWANDQIYQAILPLAARAHHAWDPHKGATPYANYHQFSTRYAGAIWDPAATVLPGAAQRIDWGPSAAKLFHWADYTYLRPRGNKRSDLVLQLINPPPERACTYDDNRVNPPLSNLATAITLPAGLKVRGVFAATAEPTLHQEALPFRLTARTLAFTVPKLRFWTMVVVQLEGQGEWK